MIQEYPSYTIRFHVWFVIYRGIDGEEKTGFSFVQSPDQTYSNPLIEVPQGQQLISFGLRTASFDHPVDPNDLSEAELIANQVLLPADQAMFPTQPFQWVVLDSGLEIASDTPSMMQVQRVSSLKCNLLDCNTNTQTTQEIFHMRMIVMQAGKIYWSQDPTVANMPDDVGPGGGTPTELGSA